MFERSDVTLELKSNENFGSPKLLSPLTLAFLGDAVFELLVRERFVSQGNAPVRALHQKAVSVVCAAAQSEAVALLEGLLTDEETEIYKRGRNANGHHVPKNADPVDYRRATGLEALFGYLYLKGDQARLLALFECIWKNTGC